MIVIDITGSLKGEDITVSFKVPGQGREMKVEYTGAVEGDPTAGAYPARKRKRGRVS